MIAGLTPASSLTAARERFLLNANGHIWAAAAEAEALASKQTLCHARWKSAQLGADRPESAPTLAVAWQHSDRPPPATYAATTTQVDNGGAIGGSSLARSEYGTQAHRYSQCRCQRLQSPHR